MTLVFSCEHAGNQVPLRFRRLFKDNWDVLETHRGYDLGIEGVFRFFCREFNAPSVSTRLTRLLLDHNRSIGNPGMFSEFSGSLGPAGKRYLVNHYNRYVSSLEKYILKGLATGPVLHVSFHSFTPVFNGLKRKVDFGILFDPASGDEQTAAQILADTCSGLDGLTVRFNEPYLGTDDGMTTLFRSRYGHRGYSGLDLEFNQRELFPVPSKMAEALIAAVETWLNTMERISRFESQVK